MTTQEKELYFLLADLGYDGISMTTYTDKKSALKQFQKDKKFNEENPWHKE